MRPISFLASALALVLGVSPAPTKAPHSPKVTPKKSHVKVQGPALYVVGYSHLDTEWCWNYPQVIREFIPNTLHENFSLFEKYPDYVFNWTGANRYRFMKQYYPADFATLKQYVKAGKWFPNGSSLEELDVNNPNSESILRQVLYGNEWFNRELGTSGVDFILPDCFGFPASLPSILHHAGIKGFSTQKLTWGSAVGIPFNLGVWKGPDGAGMVSALNAGAYDEDLEDDQSNDQNWIDRINNDDVLKIDYRYYGVGDRGGAPTEKSVKNLELSLHGTGPIKVIGGKGDQIFKDLSADQIAQLPTYQGDLELTQHSAGSLTSESEMKRWNHKNELLADAAERSSLIADWVGALPYDKARLTDGWLRFLPGQFHDLMAGTALPRSYEFAWNDQVVAANEFTGVLSESVGAATRALDTRAYGVPVVVYNPLSLPREDVVEATLHFPKAAPEQLVAVASDGSQTPVQILSRNGKDAKVIFLSKLPPVGLSVYDVRSGQAPSGRPVDKLSVSKNTVENGRYRITVDGNGDIASIHDKIANRELLSAPSRLAYVYHNPTQFPAWNMDWRDAQKPPRAYVKNPISVKVIENGPVRVALQITRESEGNRFVQTVRLAQGGSGNRVEIGQSIDWRGKESALKATFPLTVSNPKATYNWGMGAIQRGNNDPKKYEVAAHDWIDLTNPSGDYGVTLLPGFKFGSDKPTDNQLRLTLLYTPGTAGGYQHQGTQDWGHHDFWYGLTGHIGAWSLSNSQWEGLRLNQPPISFQATSHNGTYGRNISFARVSTHGVGISALKQAEGSKEIIIRLQEMAGKDEPDTHVAFIRRVVSAREVNGQEQTIGKAKVVDGQLVFDAGSYAPHAFAVTIENGPTVGRGPVASHALKLPYNVSGFSSGDGQADGNFDGKGASIPGELIPSTVTSNGIRFSIASRASGAKNVVIPTGQTLKLPAGKARTLYVLGASVDHDRSAAFKFGGVTKSVPFQSWGGFVGQWDKRLWDGPQPELTYGWDLHLAGLVHGYVKQAQIAWYADHKRLADGKNAPYEFCYLFNNKVAIPDGATSVTLPRNSKLRIVAATVAQNPNEETTPAQPLFDTLRHGNSTDGPGISPAGGTFSDAVPVKFEEPLFWNAAEPLRYTLDGSTPSLKSQKYTGQLWLSKSTTLKVAQVDSAGNVGKVTTANYTINDTTPPKVVSATEFPNAPYVRLEFSEPVNPSGAIQPSHYKFNGVVAKTADVSPDSKTVLLELASPVTGDGQLEIIGVTDNAERPNLVNTQPFTVAMQQPVFEQKAVQNYDETNQGKTIRNSKLPVEGTAQWTINQFVYLKEQPKDLTMFSGFGNGRDQNGAERFLIYNRGQIFFWGSDIDISAGVPFDLNRWQMITISYDGTSIRIYKDGKLVKTEAVSLQKAAPTVQLAPRPAWENGSRLNGSLGEFTIWNTALPVESIQSLLKTAPTE